MPQNHANPANIGLANNAPAPSINTTLTYIENSLTNLEESFGALAKSIEPVSLIAPEPVGESSANNPPSACSPIEHRLERIQSRIFGLRDAVEKSSRALRIA